ncbi:MAG: hypothetical protein R3C59_14365 [Planctomycetaceae bacterium]
MMDTPGLLFEYETFHRVFERSGAGRLPPTDIQDECRLPVQITA